VSGLSKKADLVEQWAELTFKGKSAGPKGIYEVKKFSYYLEFTGMTPEELLKEARENLHTRKTQIKILNYHKWLREEKDKNPAAAYAYLKNVRSFYGFYNIPLKFRRGDINKPKQKKVDYRLSLDEIKGMLHAAPNLRGRAIIIALESTGLREGDIATFLRSDIEPLLDKEPPVMIELETEKCGVKGYPFLHKTAVKILKEYLSSRTDNSKWLFPTLLQTATKSEEDRHLEVRELNRIVQDAFHNAGFKEGNYRIRGHCLRKFLISRLQDAGIETNVWKMIVGKIAPEETYSTDKLREAYISALDKVDPEALVNNYARMEDLLQRIEELKNHNQTLELELEKLKNKRGIEAILDIYKQMQGEVNREAFASSKAVSMSKTLNGRRPVTVVLEQPKMNGGEMLALKALARTFMKLYDDSERGK
jgi:integrase